MPVTVQQDLFDQRVPREDVEGVVGWPLDPQFYIDVSDLRLGAAALQQASRRFMHVDVFGREVDEGDLPSYGEYTPNSVGPLRVHGTRGLVISADTKGELTVSMADTMIRILVEEFTVAGVNAHVGPLPPGVRERDLETWTPPA